MGCLEGRLRQDIQPDTCVIIKPIDKTPCGYPFQLARVLRAVTDEGPDPYIVAVLYCPLSKADKWPGYGHNLFGTWYVWLAGG